MTNPSDPAFQSGSYKDGFTQAGLTKREWFAGMAMQGLCTNLLQSVEGHHLLKRLEKSAGMETEDLSTCQSIAKNAVAFADALIAELSKEPND